MQRNVCVRLCLQFAWIFIAERDDTLTVHSARVDVSYMEHEKNSKQEQKNSIRLRILSEIFNFIMLESGEKSAELWSFSLQNSFFIQCKVNLIGFKLPAWAINLIFCFFCDSITIIWTIPIQFKVFKAKKKNKKHIQEVLQMKCYFPFIDLKR